MIPHPKPTHLVDDDMVHVSITESLAHMMAMDNCPHFDLIRTHDGDSVSLLTESPFAQGKVDPSVDYHMALMTWSDGFQANYSTKVNRLKPWIKTATIAFHRAIRSGASVDHMWKTTFPVALGSEYARKEGVDKLFYDELRWLDTPGGRPFYCGQHRNEVRVRVTLVLVRGDQPERRKFCGLVGVNGNFGASFGTIGNFKKIATDLPACRDCLDTMTKMNVIRKCENCLNWDAHTNAQTTLNRFTPPDKYPE